MNWRKIFRRTAALLIVIGLLTVVSGFTDVNQPLKADELYQAGDFNGAIKLYNEDLQLNPNDAKVYNDRGLVYMNGLKQYEPAIADFDKAIELNPNDVVAYNNRGIVYYKLNQYELAIVDFDKAIEINPNYALAYNNRGIYYEKLGEEKKAQADFAKAKQLWAITADIEEE